MQSKSRKVSTRHRNLLISILVLQAGLVNSWILWNQRFQLRLKHVCDRNVLHSSFSSEDVTVVPGPPLDTKPDYENIIGPLGRRVDSLFMNMFCDKLAEQVEDQLLARNITSNDTYIRITELATILHRQYPPTVVKTKAQNVLRNLFPSWMPGSYAILFSRPFPAFSARMNAWATRVAGTWLMGECAVNDIVLEDGSIGHKQGLLVKRCRFLEESGCASVCVNCCKLPTQNFFAQDMGLPLTMEPNYDTFECQFSFGKTPTLETEGKATATPCLARCPSQGALRTRHKKCMT